jgi:hypothetical protein
MPSIVERSQQFLSAFQTTLRFCTTDGALTTTISLFLPAKIALFPAGTRYVLSIVKKNSRQ